MNVLPSSLVTLIEALGQLPGVGPRSAERFAYFLVKRDTATSQRLADALVGLHKNIAVCPITFAMMNARDSLSPLYSDPKRDKTIVAVIADPFDIAAIEKTGLYNGTYHVLGGLISPIDGIGPHELHISELLERIDKDDVKEIILATNVGVEGETTALYLQQQLANKDVRLTRLARGLPIGVDLEYADHITLGSAISGRQSL